MNCVPVRGVAGLCLTLAAGCTSARGDGGLAEGRVAPEPCTAPSGVSGAPQDIQQTVALMNALPRPTSVACFLESLSRPLQVYFTRSQFSAQPAAGADSPRTFIINGPLFLSFVPDGVAKDVVEMGFRTSPQRAIRAELIFPLTEAVRAADMADHVAVSELRTFCGDCHAHEVQTYDAFLGDRAFESDVIVPSPAAEVELEWLRVEADDCDPTLTPQRCELLTALFGHGELEASQAFAAP